MKQQYSETYNELFYLLKESKLKVELPYIDGVLYQNFNIDDITKDKEIDFEVVSDDLLTLENQIANFYLSKGYKRINEDDNSLLNKGKIIVSIKNISRCLAIRINILDAKIYKDKNNPLYNYEILFDYKVVTDGVVGVVSSRLVWPLYYYDSPSLVRLFDTFFLKRFDFKNEEVLLEVRSDKGKDSLSLKLNEEVSFELEKTVEQLHRKISGKILLRKNKSAFRSKKDIHYIDYCYEAFEKLDGDKIYFYDKSFLAPSLGEVQIDECLTLLFIDYISEDNTYLRLGMIEANPDKLNHPLKDTLFFPVELANNGNAFFKENRKRGYLDVEVTYHQEAAFDINYKVIAEYYLAVLYGSNFSYLREEDITKLKEYPENPLIDVVIGLDKFKKSNLRLSAFSDDLPPDETNLEAIELIKKAETIGEKEALKVLMDIYYGRFGKITPNYELGNKYFALYHSEYDEKTLEEERKKYASEMWEIFKDVSRSQKVKKVTEGVGVTHSHDPLYYEYEDEDEK